MSKYETRIMPRHEAEGFINNMRWFAGMSRITAKPVDKKKTGDFDLYRVRATRHAFAQYMFD